MVEFANYRNLLWLCRVIYCVLCVRFVRILVRHVVPMTRACTTGDYCCCTRSENVLTLYTKKSRRSSGKKIAVLIRFLFFHLYDIKREIATENTARKQILFFRNRGIYSCVQLSCTTGPVSNDTYYIIRDATEEVFFRPKTNKKKKIKAKSLSLFIRIV